MLRAIGALLVAGLLVVAGFVYDTGWNDGRFIATLMGRDRLVTQCLPTIRTRLADQGFTPTDVEMGDPVSVAFASGPFGSTRVLSGPFTFSDGPEGQRVDGQLVCRVHGKEVEVEVRVEGTPLRAA